MAPTQFSVAGPYGGFWLRVVARIIDTVIMTVVMVVIEVLWRGASDGYDTSAEEGFWLLIWLIGHWLYYTGLHASQWQATLGKRLLGLRVVNLEGQRISFGHATGRYFAEFLSALILLIGYLMVAFTERKQGLHDMLANTLVVKPEAISVIGNPIPYAGPKAREPIQKPPPRPAENERQHPMDAPRATDHESKQGRFTSGDTERTWVFAGFSENGEVQRLVVRESDFAHADGELIFGRNSERCHLVIPDMTVSGVHGQIRLGSGAIELVDLGSTNGTKVNGVVVEPKTRRRLADGDLVSFGGAELRVFASPEATK